MKTIKIIRKRKIASGAMPFWIIASSLTKDQFKKKYNLDTDLCDTNKFGLPIPRLNIGLMHTIGVRIESGETLEIPIDDDVQSIFASTVDGSLSNEIRKSEIQGNLTLTTKGGFKNTSYPYFEIEKETQN